MTTQQRIEKVEAMIARWGTVGILGDCIVQLLYICRNQEVHIQQLMKVEKNRLDNIEQHMEYERNKQ